MEIKIKYHDKNMEKLEFIDNKSDWIDLRAAETVTLGKGEFKTISLGISVQLPEGYEAHLAPRSSTFKNFGLIQTNGVGVIDESYCGDDDLWMMPVIAVKDTKVEKGDRICQFRILEKMKNITIKEVDSLNNANRDGFGSTGIK